MAQPYLDDLDELMKDVGESSVVCKHFFSGAACYNNGKIFASLTPIGLALKLPEKKRDELLSKGAKSLRYFLKAPVKKEYVVLANKMVDDTEAFEDLVEEARKYAGGETAHL